MSDFLIESGSIGADYAVAGESQGPRFPWLQASCYAPANVKTQVGLGLVRDAIDVAQSSELDNALSWISTSYDDEGAEVEFGAVTDDVRWVILSRPKMFGMVKATGEVVHLLKGMKERGEVTVSQVLLACLVSDKLVKDSEGNPQIFTLKLRSSKTGLIGAERDKDFGMGRNGGHKTIAQLNAALVAKAGAKPGNWMGHTVSVQLAAIAEKFESKSTGDASLGVRFVFKDGAGARPLTTANVKDIHEFITSPDFKALAANPFNKEPKKEEEYSYEVAVDDSALDAF